MEKVLMKTVSLTSLTAMALFSLYKLCMRLGWKICPSKTDSQEFEIYLPKKDADLWDFVMEGLV